MVGAQQISRTFRRAPSWRLACSEAAGARSRRPTARALAPRLGLERARLWRVPSLLLTYLVTGSLSLLTLFSSWPLPAASPVLRGALAQNPGGAVHSKSAWAAVSVNRLAVRKGVQRTRTQTFSLCRCFYL